MATDRKIKICFLISGDLWAGAEVQAYQMLESLLSFSDLELSAVLLNHGVLADRIRQLGIDLTVIEESQNGFFSILRQLKDKFRGQSIDILHTHRYKENILGAHLKKNCEIKRLIQTVHGMPEKFTCLKKLRMNLYGKLNGYYSRKRFYKIICVSNEMYNDLLNLYPREKLMVMHNAVNLNNITPDDVDPAYNFGVDLPSEALLIGTAGRMVPVKSYDFLLKVAQKVIEKFQSTYFILAGEGPLQSELEAFSAELGIKENVKFVGFQNDINSFLGKLNIFVMSSVHEGIPMILLEAMAMQKPVVATGVGGIKEVIEDNISGILTPYGDADSMAQKIIDLIANKEVRNQLGISARKRIADRFSSESQKKKLYELYTGEQINQ
ncbi:MAG: glycosyltransferase [Candidatus Zixiibacteriota bacterium]